MSYLRRITKNVALADVSSSRNNYFDHIRIVAAFAVLVSHSIPICGTAMDSTFYSLTKLGYYAVAVFFFLSGFLICKSWLSCENLRQFVVARVLRIYPGLCLALALTLFVLGPLVTRCAISEYFQSRATAAYAIWNVTLLKSRFELPGVFTDTPFAKVVNGSIWTLPYEMWCYIGIGVGGVLGLWKRRYPILWIAVALQILFMSKSFNLITSKNDFLARAIDLSSQFATGAACYVYRDKIALRMELMLLFLLIVAAGAIMNNAIQHVLWHMSVPYLTLCVGFLLTGESLRFPISNDLSYGMYIYAFPLQQLVVFLYPGMFWWQNVLIATALTYLFAWSSWRLVEKPSLKFARTLRDRMRVEK